MVAAGADSLSLEALEALMESLLKADALDVAGGAAAATRAG